MQNYGKAMIELMPYRTHFGIEMGMTLQQIESISGAAAMEAFGKNQMIG